MTRVRWAVAAAVAAVAGAGGCVSCESRSARAAWENGPACETPAGDRRHLYAVLVNGAVPAGPTSLEGLRDGLAARGYVKTYFGQVIHAGWLAGEMRSVARCDPAARFVVVGADIGAPVAAALARNAAADGLNVDALVLLEPVGVSADGGCPVRTVLVSCGAACSAPHTETAAVPGATRLTLPGHAGTADLVAGLLKESATRVEVPPAVFDGPPDPDGLPPRDFTPPPGAPPEWLFLHDRPGYFPVPLSPPPPSSRPNVGPIAPSLVPRGGYLPPEPLPRPQFPPVVVPVPVPQPLPTPPGQPLPAPRPLDPAR